MLKSASDWDGGWASIVVASQTLSLPSLDDCVVLVWIKTRAGMAGVYLKTIVTCVKNFGTFIEWLWNGNGGWASIVAVSQTLLLSSLDDCA